LPIAPKSIELEQRLSRLEQSCRALQQESEATRRHLIALQAQLDHFMAMMGL